MLLVRRPARLLLICALSLSACGGDSEPAKVREVVERFGEASAKKDYQRICDELIDPTLAKNVEDVGLPCELAFKRGLGEVRGAKLEIKSVAVNGDKASVGIRTSAQAQRPSDDVMQLVRDEDGWRISALSGGTAPAP